MADTDQLYLVQWEDRFMSVISARDIVFPLKKHYQEGELIKAKFQKKTFQAAICEIHRKYKALEVNMAKTFLYCCLPVENKGQISVPNFCLHFVIISREFLRMS